MEVTRYAPGDEARAGSLLLSAAVVALAVTGIILAAPDVVTRIIVRGPLVTYPVPIPPEPQPIPDPKPVQHNTAKPDPQPRPDPAQPKPLIDVPQNGPIFTGTGPVSLDPPPASGSGTGAGIAADPPTPAPPVFIEPVTDPRYAREFQPPYPAEERRLGNAGLVVVRVLIGTDGRVKMVELVSSASPAFFDATRRQALARWRFRPATRDGVPIERWRTMRVNFVLTDE